MKYQLCVAAILTQSLLTMGVVSSQSSVAPESIPTSSESRFPTPYNSEPEKTEPMSAEEAAATAVLPPGFRCEVFASEPDVQQPIAMCFDDRGRVWVAECYTYSEKPGTWDNDLRDRIIILEDTDGDGRADKRDVFWDEGVHLTSVAKVDGGVYALCPPQLLFLPDADGDDIPDSAPQVLLDGFDIGSSSHNVASGLKVGPDGWLYGRHGILSVSMVGAPGSRDNQRTPVNTAIWRYHPDQQIFEVFCNGGTNPWGLDWNADGQLFYTNTVIGHLWHAIPGAYYERMFGAHSNPHVYQVITHTADHVHWDTGEKWSDIRAGMSNSTAELGGGHAHMGCMIYQGGVWPDEYVGNLFTSNFHGRRINMDILEREGCGYVAHHGKDFMLMKDPFYRGLDVLAGPDGQMWINDWSDTGECHDNTGLHRSSGRIYRVVYEGGEKSGAKAQGTDWLTARSRSDFGTTDIESMLTSAGEAKRALGVRYLCEDAAEDPTTIARLLQIANEDSSGLVRLEVAAGLQRLPVLHRLEIASVLCQHREDADDRQQPLMIWYGIEPAVAASPEAAAKLAIDTQIPTIRRLIARRLGESIEDDPEAVDRLLASALIPENRGKLTEILRGLDEGLRGRTRADAPPQWESVVAAVQRDGFTEEKSLVRELSLVFLDGRTRKTVFDLAFNVDADPAMRRAALASLMRQPTADLLPKLLAAGNDHVLASDVVRAFAYFDDPVVAERLMDRWNRSPLDRVAAIDSLVARITHTSRLLDAIEAGTMPSTAISPYQARQIDNHGDAELSERLRKLWGNLRDTPADKRQDLQRLKTILTKDRIGRADARLGKTLFMKQCSACHQLYGDGHSVGPNLTGSDRQNLDYLLSNMIDPSSVVASAYRMSVLVLDDGRVLSGVVTNETARTIAIQTQQRVEHVDKESILERRISDLSLMPDGILSQLSDDDVANLIAYLMTQRPLDSVTTTP